MSPPPQIGCNSREICRHVDTGFSRSHTASRYAATLLPASSWEALAKAANRVCKLRAAPLRCSTAPRAARCVYKWNAAVTMTPQPVLWQRWQSRGERSLGAGSADCKLQSVDPGSNRCSLVVIPLSLLQSMAALLLRVVRVVGRSTPALRPHAGQLTNLKHCCRGHL